MFELLYSSVSKAPLSSENCRKLVEQAENYNCENGITGILLYDGYLFMQLLEGDRDAVKSLFTRVEQDDRHTNVSIIAEGEISERTFSNWAMVYQRVEQGFIEENSIHLKGVIPRRPNLPIKNYGARLQAVILRDYSKLMNLKF